MVFARRVSGQELTFGVSGKLIMNALVMYDHQTDSLWSQFLGEAVKGPLTGKKLTLLPAQFTTWGAWRQQHPDTTALAKDGYSSRDRYESYYRGGNKGILGESNPDHRLPAKDLVIGLAEGATQRAYPFRYLQTEQVVNDSFEDRPVVVAFITGAESGAVFHRQVGDRTLTFQRTNGASGLDPLMIDIETGTKWSMASGRAVSGALAGQQLEQLPTHLSFWFAWSDFYPNTELYQPDGVSG